MEGNVEETRKVEIRGHVFYTRPLNDDFDLIYTDDDLFKSALIDLNRLYDDVVDMAYDGDDAEYVIKGEDGQEYWGDDAEGICIFFIHKGMLQFRIQPGTGCIGFMVNKDAHVNQEMLKEAKEKIKLTGQADVTKGTFTEEVGSDGE